jgi:hypothetical protein
MPDGTSISAAFQRPMRSRGGLSDAALIGNIANAHVPGQSECFAPQPRNKSNQEMMVCRPAEVHSHYDHPPPLVKRNLSSPNRYYEKQVNVDQQAVRRLRRRSESCGEWDQSHRDGVRRDGEDRWDYTENYSPPNQAYTGQRQDRPSSGRVPSPAFRENKWSEPYRPTGEFTYGPNQPWQNTEHAYRNEPPRRRRTVQSGSQHSQSYRRSHPTSPRISSRRSREPSERGLSRRSAFTPHADYLRTDDYRDVYPTLDHHDEKGRRRRSVPTDTSHKRRHSVSSVASSSRLSKHSKRSEDHFRQALIQRMLRDGDALRTRTPSLKNERHHGSKNTFMPWRRRSAFMGEDAGTSYEGDQTDGSSNESYSSPPMTQRSTFDNPFEDDNMSTNTFALLLGEESSLHGSKTRKSKTRKAKTRKSKTRESERSVSEKLPEPTHSNRTESGQDRSSRQKSAVHQSDQRRQSSSGRRSSGGQRSSSGRRSSGGQRSSSGHQSDKRTDTRQLDDNKRSFQQKEFMGRLRQTTHETDMESLQNNINPQEEENTVREFVIHILLGVLVLFGIDFVFRLNEDTKLHGGIKF